MKQKFNIEDNFKQEGPTIIENNLSKEGQECKNHDRIHVSGLNEALYKQHFLDGVFLDNKEKIEYNGIVLEPGPDAVNHEDIMKIGKEIEKYTLLRKRIYQDIKKNKKNTDQDLDINKNLLTSTLLIYLFHCILSISSSLSSNSRIYHRKQAFQEVVNVYSYYAKYAKQTPPESEEIEIQKLLNYFINSTDIIYCNESFFDLFGNFAKLYINRHMQLSNGVHQNIFSKLYYLSVFKHKQFIEKFPDLLGILQSVIKGDAFVLSTGTKVLKSKDGYTITYLLNTDKGFKIFNNLILGKYQRMLDFLQEDILIHCNLSDYSIKSLIEIQQVLTLLLNLIGENYIDLNTGIIWIEETQKKLSLIGNQKSKLMITAFSILTIEILYSNGLKKEAINRILRLQIKQNINTPNFKGNFTLGEMIIDSITEDFIKNEGKFNLEYLQTIILYFEAQSINDLNSDIVKLLVAIKSGILLDKNLWGKIERLILRNYPTIYQAYKKLIQNKKQQIINGTNNDKQDIDQATQNKKEANFQSSIKSMQDTIGQKQELETNQNNTRNDMDFIADLATVVNYIDPNKADKQIGLGVKFANISDLSNSIIANKITGVSIQINRGIGEELKFNISININGTEIQAIMRSGLLEEIKNPYNQDISREIIWEFERIILEILVFLFNEDFKNIKIQNKLTKKETKNRDEEELLAHESAKIEEKLEKESENIDMYSLDKNRRAKIEFIENPNFPNKNLLNWRIYRFMGSREEIIKLKKPRKINGKIINTKTIEINTYMPESLETTNFEGLLYIRSMGPYLIKRISEYDNESEEMMRAGEFVSLYGDNSPRSRRIVIFDKDLYFPEGWNKYIKEEGQGSKFSMINTKEYKGGWYKFDRRKPEEPATFKRKYIRITKANQETLLRLKRLNQKNALNNKLSGAALKQLISSNLSQEIEAEIMGQNGKISKKELLHRVYAENIYGKTQLINDIGVNGDSSSELVNLGNGLSGIDQKIFVSSKVAEIIRSGQAKINFTKGIFEYPDGSLSPIKIAPRHYFGGNLNQFGEASELRRMKLEYITRNLRLNWQQTGGYEPKFGINKDEEGKPIQNMYRGENGELRNNALETWRDLQRKKIDILLKKIGTLDPEFN